MKAPNRPFAVRLYERLARSMLPAEFYRDVGPQIVESFEALYADAARQSWFTAVGLFLRELRSIIGTGFRERRRLPRTFPGRRVRFPIWRRIAGDVRTSVRGLWRAKGLSAVVVVMIALGVSVTATVFALVDQTLLRSLPYSDAKDLVTVTVHDVRPGGGVLASSQTEIDNIAQLPGVASAVGYDVIELNLADDVGDPMRVEIVRMGSDLIRLLGIQTVLGRSFTNEEIVQRQHLALLGHHVWQQRYGSDPGILGRSVLIQAVPYTIIGVLPARFAFPTRADVWTIDGPYPNVSPQGIDRADRRYFVLARRERQNTTKVVQRQLQALAIQLAETYPATNRDVSFSVEPLHDTLTGSLRRPLYLLLGAAGFVLMIVGGNVASLLLVRGASRHKEWAVRRALGASVARIRALIVIETVTLSVAGGLLGLAGAGLFLSLVYRISPAEFPVVDTIAVDGPVILTMAGLATVMGVVIGLMPSFSAGRIVGSEILGSRGATSSRSQQRVQTAMVVGQIALATVLAVSATLLAVSFQKLTNVDPGFDRANLITIRLHNGSNGRGPVSFWRDVVDVTSDIPGVAAVAGAAFQPMEVGFGQQISIRGISSTIRPSADFMPVVGNFFLTVGVPLLEGRLFTVDDDAEAPGVAIVNASFVRRYLQGNRVLGAVIEKTISRGAWGATRSLEIVGVVGDMRNRGLAIEPEPMIAVPHEQSPFGYMRLFIRTSVDPGAVVKVVQERIWSIDPLLPVDDLQYMEDVVHQSVRQTRLMMYVAATVAVLALILSALGVLGVVSYSASQRNREMGIRMALGAMDRRVVGLIMRQGLVMALAGVLLGLMGAWATSGFLESQLFEVQATDPGTLGLVAVVLIGVTLVASYVPARRATRTDPVHVLRAES